MDFNLDFGIVHSRKLLFTPQLKQALQILEMSSQELFDYVGGQMEQNPVLEFAKSERSPYEINYCVTVEQLKGEESERIDIDKLGCYTTKLSLKEYLLFQLHVSNTDKSTLDIGEYLIDNVDDKGYLMANITDTAAYFNVSQKKITDTIKLLQTFDPPGICARNLKECLSIQLMQIRSADCKALDIVKYCLDDIACGREQNAAEKLGITRDRVRQLFKLVKKLEPKPGREFYNIDDVKYIVPDIIIKKTDEGFKGSLNHGSIPSVRICKYYRELLSSEISSKSRKFIENKLNAGIWLLKCINLRKKALKKLALYIAGGQQDFFAHGPQYLKPFNMRNAAICVNMNEYILNKAIYGKYLQCTWGYLELKHFFDLQRMGQMSVY